MSIDLKSLSNRQLSRASTLVQPTGKHPPEGDWYCDGPNTVCKVCGNYFKRFTMPVWKKYETCQVCHKAAFDAQKADSRAQDANSLSACNEPHNTVLCGNDNKNEKGVGAEKLRKVRESILDSKSQQTVLHVEMPDSFTKSRSDIRNKGVDGDNRSDSRVEGGSRIDEERVRVVSRAESGVQLRHSGDKGRNDLQVRGEVGRETKMRKTQLRNQECQSGKLGHIRAQRKSSNSGPGNPNSDASDYTNPVAAPAAAARPRAKSAKYANPHHSAGTSNTSSPERSLSLDRPAEAETRGTIRPLVRFTLFRVRLLDADAKYASIKDLLDGCCEAGLLPGDRDDQITLEVVQVKANAFKNEKTVIEITIP